MTVAFQRVFGIFERWNNKVTPSLRKAHELSYRSNRITLRLSAKRLVYNIHIELIQKYF